MEPNPKPVEPQAPALNPPESPAQPTPVISQTVSPPAGSVAPPPFAFSDSSAAPAGSNSPGQPVPPVESATPTVMVGGPGASPGSSAPVISGGGPTTPATSATPPASGGRRFSKKLLIPVIAAVLLFGGAAAYYFGYYTRPSVIYSQSLKNTGKGYDKLVTYADQQTRLSNQSYTGSGSYQFKSTSFSTDGKLGWKSDEKNGEFTFDVGAAATRVSGDVRAIKSSNDALPDLYVKASGLKGLGTVLNEPALDPELAKLDNNWIAIDHTLLENLDTQTADGSVTSPTRSQILDEARAFGRVNQQYLFSTSKDKAVTKVVKQYGKETVDGYKTYHYKVALQKDNVRKYIYAQRDALKASSLNDWLKKNKLDKIAYDSFNNTADSASNIKAGDTYDVWMDVSHRIVYKIRFSDKAQSGVYAGLNSSASAAANYTDVGLGYKGGSTYPFFIAGKYTDSVPAASSTPCNNCGATAAPSTLTFLFTTSVDTKSGATSMKLNVKSTGSDAGTLDAGFVLKPSSAPVKISKPGKTIPLSQVLSELGLGDLLSQTQMGSIGGSSQAKAQDSKRKADVETIQTQLEAFFQENGYYPSLKDMNSSAWLNANMKTLDQDALIDPSNPAKSKTLLAAPAAKSYAYAVTDASGASCEADDTKCAKYTLTATLGNTANGQSSFVKTNLD